MRMTSMAVFTLVVAMAMLSPAPAHAQFGDWLRGVGRRTAQAGRDAVEFGRDAAGGTRDMVRAYSDMREANWRNSDRYFHARGNQDAANRGPGGRFAASVISNARELTDRMTGDSAADSARDQEANHWGRNGGPLDRFRPDGLPEQY